MKDIEQLFSDKLKHHEVAPPAAPWDTMAKALRQKRRRKRAVYGAVAAAVLLLIVPLGWLLQTGSEAVSPVVYEQILPSSDALGKKSNRTDNQNVIVNKETVTVSKLFPDSTAQKIKPVLPLPPNGHQPDYPLEQPVTVPPLVSEVKEVPLAKEEQPMSRTLVVDAARYRVKPADTTSAKTDRAPAVTIIYQPNPATLAKKESLAKKVAQTLTQIKEKGISYSELRSAKDDLVDRVFSEPKPEDKRE